MIPQNLRDVLSAYGSRIILWGEINARRVSSQLGGLDETEVIYISSQPGFFLEATNEYPFRHFTYPWDSGVRLKRSAQNVLKGDPVTSIVPANGILELLNHDETFDTLFGAQGYDTAGEVVMISFTAIPPAYSGRALGPQSGVLLDGIAKERNVSDQVLRLEVRGHLDKMQQHIATDTITAENYPLAPESTIGLTKPVLLGTCNGIELILIDPSIEGGKYLIAGHGCDSGTFYRNGLAMETSEYTPDLTADDGNAYITLSAGLQGARITGDISGIRPSHLGVFSDKLTEINVYLLSLIGITEAELSSTGLADCRSTYDYAVGLPIFQETTIQEVWDELNAGIPLILDLWRDGTYFLAPWAEPSGTAEITIDDNWVLNHEIVEAPRIGGTILSYAPNATVFTPTEIAAILFTENSDRAQLLQQSSQTYTKLITGAQDDLEIQEYDTRLLSLADVKDLVNIRHNLYGFSHLHHRIMVGSIGAGVCGLGSVITFTRDRLGLQTSTGLIRLADIEETWDSSGVQVRLIGVEARR